ncbi:tetratricopeptide repeat protein [Pantanalinema rosaneae CENA516]|uniref:tetratricopeptide repeat protein n=1 Tax=Pantanalinema rosaneae TaxID=1620701 RepID=UPI003D6DE136
MTTSTLTNAIERYETAIVALEVAGERLSAEEVLEALVARSVVHQTLNAYPRASLRQGLGNLWARMTHHKPRSQRRDWQRVVNRLDARLNQQATYINQAVKLEDWQVLLPPPEREWLRLLEAPKISSWRDRFDWLWQGLSISLLSVALSLLVGLSARFLEGGPDALGAFAVIMPSVVGLLTGGGALTKTGRQAMEHILSSLRIARHWWDEIFCGLSALFLLSMISFWLALPYIAVLYEQSADLAYRDGQLAMAEYRYTRALKLHPSHLDIHYKLGRLYEDLTQIDQAAIEYQIAVKGGRDGEAYKAYDRLARIYILDGTPESYSKAVSLLNEGLGLALAKNDQETMYAIYKNLGWARLNQERYIEAGDVLQRAINLAPERAPAYCLQAQALEGLQDPIAAMAAWEQCLRFANQKDPDEDLWIGLALKRLRVEMNSNES